MTVLLQVSNIAYAHGGKQLFSDLSFEIKADDRLALIGPNGAGKSSLFRLMAQELQPDRGAVTLQRGLEVGYLHQEAQPDPEMTVIDTVALAAGDPAALERRLSLLECRMAEPLDDEELSAVMDEHGHILAKLESARVTGAISTGKAILDGLRIPKDEWDLPVGSLSGGEGKIVALAGLLAAAPDLLLLDEPDNHLDLAAKQWLEALLSGYPGAVATITHDRYFMDHAANRIFELEDGNLRTWPGNYSAFVAAKRKEYERLHELRKVEMREFKKLKKSAEALTQWARQNEKFAPRAENQRRKVAEERERLELTAPPSLTRRQADFSFDSERAGSLVVAAQGLCKRFDDNVIVLPLDLEIRHGERVALVGPNGAGKTTLVKLLLGKLEADAGTVRVGPSVTTGYYAQLQETLPAKMTPLEFVRKQKSMSEQQAVSFLSSLLMDHTTSRTPIERLSGGEKARLQIGSLILAGSNFLVLDEPTNNLDIQAVEALEAALDEYDCTILAISHDRYFLEEICDRVLEIDDGVVRDYPGDYDWYIGNRDRGNVLTRSA